MKESLNNKAIILLNQIGDLTPFELTVIRGGANNRVFLVETENTKYLMKFYYTNKDDKRDRLGAEFGFSKFLWSKDIHSIPQPLAEDLNNRNALFEYVEGNKILPKDVDKSLVTEALDFWISINSRKNSIHAKQLPMASEAYFSISGHLNNVSSRLKKLSAIEIDNSVSLAARSYVKNDLLPYWEDTRDELLTDCILEGINRDEKLQNSDKCLSPSDFGFHNAIITDSGAVKFIDFEYAGWDDPAKLVCDFFCQPEIPVNMEYFSEFSKTVASQYSDSDFHQFRINLLLPVYQVKWCAVMLNDFLSGGNRRRKFANNNLSRGMRLKRQLEKSMNQFKLLTSERVVI